ncbi:MAG: hypothetical protein V3T74_02265 [Gemmatimonadales bacterium]
MRGFISAAAALLLPVAALAQTAATPPILLEAEEIALARSAAPAEVTDGATILVLLEGRYRTAAEGSNGVTCMVSRSLPLSLEPICYDPEASRTILALEIRRVEMRLSGLSPEEVDQRIAEAIGSGELLLPQRPAMAYMLSAGQILYSDAETSVGAFVPHIHLYMPYATAAQFGGLGAGPPVAPAVMSDEGKPTANLIVFVREFVEVTGASAGN